MPAPAADYARWIAGPRHGTALDSFASSPIERPARASSMGDHSRIEAFTRPVAEATARRT
jgi:hypothetical protein